MKKIIKYTAIFIILLTGTATFLIPNLGKFLDITQEPTPSDVVVSLDGGGIYRVKKALDLYRKGYSKSYKIIITSSPIRWGSRCHNAITFLKKEDVPLQDIVNIRNLHNTMQEILTVKDYLIIHHFKSVIIVSDEPYSRRILFLANKVAKFEESGLKVTVVGSNAPWWDRDYYYMNKTGTVEAILEIVKLPYNYVKYGILYNFFAKYAILDSAKKYLSPLAKDLKYIVVKCVRIVASKITSIQKEHKP